MSNKHKLSSIYNASGAQSNFGGWKSYWYHIPLKIISLILGFFSFGKFDFFNMKNMTFVSKTATIEQRIGNTPYEGSKSLFHIQYNPMEWFPDSIWFDWFKANVLNKVGVGNPGLEAFIKTGLWQKRAKTGEGYVISYMSLEGDSVAQAIEAARLFKLHKSELGDFSIEYNKSCPNTESDQCSLVTNSTKEEINAFAEVGVPVYVKISVSAAPDSFVKMLDENPNVTAIVMSNTIAYGWQPIEDYNKNAGGVIPKIDWKQFGEKSPLEDKAYDNKGGGLSGKILKYYVIKSLKHFRNIGIKKDFIAGGGILCANDVDEYKEAGANAVFIGSVFMLRFWRVKSIIKRANEIF